MKTVIEMAREAGCGHESLDSRWVMPKNLERFAALVREDDEKRIAILEQDNANCRKAVSDLMDELQNHSGEAADMVQEPVAEVVWYDPLSEPFPLTKPMKIIDGSIAFMDSAEIGAKLYAQEPTYWKQRALEAEALNERLCAEFNAENGPTFMGEPVIRTTSPTAALAARQMRDALVHISEYWNRDENETAMADALWHIIETADNAIAALPILGEEK